jgi:hypothetical protein
LVLRSPESGSFRNTKGFTLAEEDIIGFTLGQPEYHPWYILRLFSDTAPAEYDINSGIQIGENSKEFLKIF